MTILALTMGDPAGIGPEITLKALETLEPWFRKSGARLRYFGDPSLLPTTSPYVSVEPIECATPPQAGIGDQSNGSAVIESIERAVAACQAGECAGVITNPINKAVLYNAGFQHPGHTEFLANLCDCRKPTVMMLTSEPLSVVPITLHTSLYDAISDIRRQGKALICHAIETTASYLHALGTPRPRLAVSGLNPHAGEGGAMGTEELEIITPVLQSFAMRDDMVVLGPLPADTMFDAHNRQRYDVALAMTHDQALIPIKTLAFDSGVNVTMGLPIIRTSPDHGTAYDIAGRGIARPDSLIAAIKHAFHLCQKATKGSKSP